MFKGLHNRLGEDGSSLTVLSLLQGKPLQLAAGDTEGKLGEIADRLRNLAGDDAEVVHMYSVYPSPGGSLEFLSLELLPLRQAIERMHTIAGGDDAPSVLSVLEPGDDIEPTSGPVGQALGHLRDALRALFNRAGENGQPLTVLSVLSTPTSTPTRSDTED